MTGDAPCGAIVDSVLNFDYASGRTSTKGADEIIAYVKRESLTIDWLLETHAHADHLSAAPYLQQKLGGQAGDRRARSPRSRPSSASSSTSGRIRPRRLAVRPSVRRRRALRRSASSGERSARARPYAGRRRLRDRRRRLRRRHAVHARLWHGPRRLPRRRRAHALSLDPPTAVAARRRRGCSSATTTRRRAAITIAWETTVGDERADNVHVHDGIGEDAFVAMRTARDATLDLPHLILPSVQVNVRGGRLPPAEDNGTRYLKLPLDLL